MGQVNRTSKTGLELIKGYEGLRRRSEPLSGGGWIVGYGHTRSAREGVEVTEREAEYLLRYDLQDVEEFVHHHVHAPLNQNEFDALVSFCWNVGKEAFASSDVLNYVNAGEMLAAAESFSAWRKARIAGRLIVVDALVRRRTAEKNLFLSHPNGPPAAPSKVVKPELDVAASVLALSDGALSIESKMNAPENVVVNTPLGIVANDQFKGADDKVAIEADDVIEEDISVDTSEADVEQFVETEIEEVENTLAFSDEAETLNGEAPADAENELPPVASIWDPSEEGVEDEDEAIDEVEDDDQGELEDEFLVMSDLDDAEAEDEGDQDDDLSDDLSRAMAAASLAAGGAVITSEILKRDDDVEIEEQLETLVGDEELIVEDVELESIETAEGEELTIETVAIDAVEAEEAEAEAEVEAEVESEEKAEDDADAQTSDEHEAFVSSLDITEAEEAADEEEESVWTDKTDSVLPEAEDESDQNGQQKRIVIDDIEYPNGMTADEAQELETADSALISGQKKEGGNFVAILPFVLLAIIGIVMAVLGLLDWWKLVQSDTPINKNELYAGPFLTLIGGFGLVFGLYFTIRKLVVREA